MKPEAPVYPIKTGDVEWYGISTRDYIAIEMMKAIISNSYIVERSIRVRRIYDLHLHAEQAYSLADALIKRSKK